MVPTTSKTSPSISKPATTSKLALPRLLRLRKHQRQSLKPRLTALVVVPTSTLVPAASSARAPLQEVDAATISLDFPSVIMEQAVRELTGPVTRILVVTGNSSLNIWCEAAMVFMVFREYASAKI